MLPVVYCGRAHPHCMLRLTAVGNTCIILLLYWERSELSVLSVCRLSPTTTMQRCWQRSAQGWERPWLALTVGHPTSTAMQHAQSRH